jgi:hypothetical protein
MCKARMKRIREAIEDARRYATLESATFARLHGTGPYPTNEGEVDAFIKERVSLHHSTWIIGLLDGALAEIEEGERS